MMSFNHHEVSSSYICYRLFAVEDGVPVSWSSDLLTMSREQQKAYSTSRDPEMFLYNLLCPSVKRMDEEEFDALKRSVSTKLECLQQQSDRLDERCQSLLTQLSFEPSELSDAVNECQRLSCAVAWLVESYPHRFRVSFLPSRSKDCEELCARLDVLEQHVSVVCDRMVCMLMRGYGRERVRSLIRRSSLGIVTICVQCLLDGSDCSQEHVFMTDCFVQVGPGDTSGVQFGHTRGGCLRLRLAVSTEDFGSVPRGSLE
jgi:hypothetical protein